MGSTLEHGIYLPSEGEKNCYQGLANNWNKVDGALGDVAGLKQLIESKFTKEIVTELPTEDINPYCIYMILKTDPETNNIYDEWVYINNAWEYLGNTQVDMTQYYTKQEVNELPAVASGVTSTKVGNYDTHLADSNIHVTSADKSKWNTVALIKQLRLVNTQVGSATTIAFANIDDTNGIKVGDKCMDLDAKMFEITAVDTTNQTVTVGSALIDLALDANVVHTSGNETVGGQKTFANNRIIVGRNTDTSSAIQLVNSNVVGGSASGASGLEVYGSSVSTDNKIGGVTVGEWSNNGGSYASIECNRTVSDVKTSNTIRNLIRNDGSKEFSAGIDNDCKLGHPYFRWSEVYATNYYYGSNNVEFSTKFVTTDTAQTITGNKTFGNGTLTVDNGIGSNVHGEIKLSGSRSGYIVADNSADGVFDSAGCGVSILLQDSGKPLHVGGYKVDANGRVFVDNTNKNPVLSVTSGLIQTATLVPKDDTANSSFRILSQLNYANGNPSKTLDVRFIQYDNANATSSIYSNDDNKTTLGASTKKWRDVLTYLVNGLTPSSLSMPVIDRTKYVDISGYFTNTGNGDINTYSVTANGWIYLRLTDIGGCQLSVLDSSNNRLYGSTSSGNLEQLCLPVTAGTVVETQWTTSTSVTVAIARFIPCQGNI